MARKSTGVGEGATARCLSLSEVADMLEGCDRVAFEACKEALKADTRKGVAAIFQKTERRLAAEEAEAQRLAELYVFEKMQFLMNGNDDMAKSHDLLVMLG